MRRRPELAGMLLAKGGWDYALVDALQPQPGDLVVPKPRYSGFFNTNIDSLLRARATSSSPASPRMSAWNPRCATPSTWNISAWCI